MSKLQKVKEALEAVRFQLNNNLYWLGVNYKTVKCEICHGAKTFKIRDKHYIDCDNCDGEGSFEKGFSYVKSGKVQDIKCKIGEGVKISYEVSTEDVGTYVFNIDDEIFDTKKEAQVAINTIIDKNNGK